jgi:hypothetical protein
MTEARRAGLYKNQDHAQVPSSPPSHYHSPESLLTPNQSRPLKMSRCNSSPITVSERSCEAHPVFYVLTLPSDDKPTVPKSFTIKYTFGEKLLRFVNTEAFVANFVPALVDSLQASQVSLSGGLSSNPATAEVLQKTCESALSSALDRSWKKEWPTLGKRRIPTRTH